MGCTMASAIEAWKASSHLRAAVPGQAGGQAARRGRWGWWGALPTAQGAEPAAKPLPRWPASQRPHAAPRRAAPRTGRARGGRPRAAPRGWPARCRAGWRRCRQRRRPAGPRTRRRRASQTTRRWPRPTAPPGRGAAAGRARRGAAADGASGAGYTPGRGAVREEAPAAAPPLASVRPRLLRAPTCHPTSTHLPPHQHPPSA